MTHRPLAGFSGLMVATALVSVAGLVFDDRTMAGEPIWLKPF
jgi:hypothetical protein